MNVLAIDIGASSGRAILGSFNGEMIKTEEIHRFPNNPVTVNGVMYWDVLYLFHEITESVQKASQSCKIDSVAVDTWGVDFGLLDSKGNLLQNPVHYRDNRTDSILRSAYKIIPHDKLYLLTGSQCMQFNTIFQLLALYEQDRELLEKASHLLMMPDLFNYFLTGEMCCETSIASTTGLVNPIINEWCTEILDAFKIPKSILKPIKPSGSVVGEYRDIKVISVCSHDTQSVLAAAPVKKNENDFMFLSSGTWSLLGVEVNKPIINGKSLSLDITNEKGYGGKTSFLKNLTGLWIIQECRREWERRGYNYSFSELEELANDAKPFLAFIDTDAPEFAKTGDLPQRIKDFCIRTSQAVPETVGEIVRCVNESLAFKYRKTISELELCTEKKYNTLYMVGGGIKSELLCKFTANAAGIEVSAGPVEASALGNIAVQLITLGHLDNIGKAREIIGKSEEIKHYNPESPDEWDKNYERYLKVIC